MLCMCQWFVVGVLSGVWMYHSLFIHLPAKGYSGCFQSFTFTNKAATHILICIFGWTKVFISLQQIFMSRFLWRYYVELVLFLKYLVAFSGDISGLGLLEIFNGKLHFFDKFMTVFKSLFLREWALVVCDFQGIFPFHLCCRIYGHKVAHSILLRTL